MATDGAVSQTTVAAWEKRWATGEGRANWLQRTRHWRSCRSCARGARRVLDLGCGVGSFGAQIILMSSPPSQELACY